MQLSGARQFADIKTAKDITAYKYSNPPTKTASLAPAETWQPVRVHHNRAKIAHFAAHSSIYGWQCDKAQFHRVGFTSWWSRCHGHFSPLFSLPTRWGEGGETDFVRLTKGSGVNGETPSAVGSRYFLCSRVAGNLERGGGNSWASNIVFIFFCFVR